MSFTKRMNDYGMAMTKEFNLRLTMDALRKNNPLCRVGPMRPSGEALVC